ncbi:MAG: MoxR family ATPase [Polyangiales bacterium]
MARRAPEPIRSPEPTLHALPLGPRVEAVLEVAHRARRPVLLEGPTGIGKSELVRGLATRLGIQHRVLDLSLLEPPDLVGLPVLEGGRTSFASPRILPTEGEGILLLEELNRAERYIQQPALQLLSARRLHEYVLPAGWSVFAAINPETGDYQVTPLDLALRARFLQVPVRADRASWLAWAGAHGVHPAVLAMARAHERLFDEVSPRAWTYASEVLSAMGDGELRDETLVRDVLGGYLPAVWVEALLAGGSLSARPFELDVHALLRGYRRDEAYARQVREWRETGATDRLGELVERLVAIVGGPECGVLAAKGDLELAALEALLVDLPGDLRERVQEAVGSNPTACVLLDESLDDVLRGYGGSALSKRVEQWKNAPDKRHRVALLVTALRARILTPQAAIELRKSNAARLSLGHLLAQLGERFGLPLVEAMQRAGVTPIRP